MVASSGVIMRRAAVCVGGLLVLAAAGAGAPAKAQSAEPTKSASISGFSWTVDTSYGVMHGQSQEFVFDPRNGRTVSRLDWTFDDDLMVSAGIRLRALNWLTLGAKGSVNVSDSATLDDFDFNVEDCPANGSGTLCHSHSPNTALQNADLLDVYGEAHVLQVPGLTLSALAGYTADYFKWQAFGGKANYTGLPPGLGISYEQWWQAPYLGAAAEYRSGPWTLNGRVIGSPWADGRDTDSHQLRSLLFKEDFGQSDMIAADIAASYQMTPSWAITLGYHYQKWYLAKGTTLVKDELARLANFTPGDSAGGNSESHIVSIGSTIDLSGIGLAATPVSLKDEMPAPPAWTGFYMGTAVGGAWGDFGWQTTALEAPPNSPFPVDQATAQATFRDQQPWLGSFGGYNWQMSNWLIGAEADFGRSNLADGQNGIPGTRLAQFNPPMDARADAVSVETEWDASARLRAGVLMAPGLLIYATGGVAIADVNARASCVNVLTIPGGGWCQGDHYERHNETLVGWTAGGGLEALLGDHWFARGEYRYTDLGSFDHEFFADAPADTVSASIDVRTQTLTAGLGYRF